MKFNRVVDLRFTNNVLTLSSPRLRGGNFGLGLVLVGICSFLLFVSSLVLVLLVISLVFDNIDSPVVVLLFTAFLGMCNVALFYGFIILAKNIFSCRAVVDFSNMIIYRWVAGVPFSRRKCKYDLKLLMQPLYSRGGSGWRLAANDSIHTIPLIDSGILGDERQAISDANTVIARIKESVPSVSILFDISLWDLNRVNKI